MLVVDDFKTITDLAPQENWLIRPTVYRKIVGSSPTGVVRDKPLTNWSITYLGSIQGEKYTLEFYSMN